MSQLVYFFANGQADGDTSMRSILGGKGANLAEMTRLGLPVPPGFTISTEACVYYDREKRHADGLREQVSAALERLEKVTGRRLGDPERPLLVSVRSGARASMPGMMDTVLNLGLNRRSVQGLAAAGDGRFAWDSYRRFVQMYGDVVLGVPHHRFETALTAARAAEGVEKDSDLSEATLRSLVDTYQGIVKTVAGIDFPEDPVVQLWGAIEAVFASWDNDRARTYRRKEGIPDAWGTAVNVQAMVFGNLGETSATGVAFTRDPSTGEQRFFGEYLVNAQGEDVVAGIRTPNALNGDDPAALENRFPVAYAELDRLQRKLEAHYHDMQDLEFTIQDGTLYLLQTRNGKRSANAAVKIAVDMAEDGLITRKDAVRRVSPAQIDALLHSRLDPAAKLDILARGLGASPGAVSGKVVFHAVDAREWAERGEKVILMRPETSPEDVEGMIAAVGIVTARGGATSHAAVVARGWGKSCVAGCTALNIDEDRRTVTIGGRVFAEGDVFTIDGAQGLVIAGAAPTIAPDPGPEFETLMTWADSIRRLGVRTNADTPHDAEVARRFGAEGIGLCRTEHMFFEEGRIRAVREMILSATQAERRAALAKILPMQRDDFVGIFRAMKGLPVTIRLLDPPLHEFLPTHGEDLAPLARDLGVDVATVEVRVASLQESNPMLGHRGCRLAITYPEVAEMQAEAIISAACLLVRDEGFDLVPEIMVPLVSVDRELEVLREVIVRTADRVIAEYGVSLTYMVGTMIELPRACITAAEVARHAEFFSFGTNDLTQTTFGLSRDDSGRFLPQYVEGGIIPADPFNTLDSAVCELVQMAAERGRATRPVIKLGICGEHGGDPASVAFCHRAGLDYVSCSPFRVPVARLAAAQAVLDQEPAG